MDYKGASGYIWTRKTIKYALTFVCASIFLTLMAFETLTLHQNDLVRRQLEKIATAALGVNVTIGGYFPHPSEHAVYLSGVRLANPPGYDADIAIHIGNIRINDISSEGNHMVFGKVVLNNVVVFMAIRRDSTNLMALLSGVNAAALKSAGPGTIMTDVRTQIFVMRPFSIPSDNSLEPADVTTLEMKDIGKNRTDASVGNDTIDILRELMRHCYRIAAERSYLRTMDTGALEKIQSSLSIGEGFVGVAQYGMPWDNRGHTK